MTRPLLQVLLSSTRPGRRGAAVADWLRRCAIDHGQFDVELVDLAEVALPLLDEPHHPRLQRYTREHTRQWSKSVDRADAFAIVTPEYNHSYPASLKNALDYLFVEWADKPVGLVSYGGVSAGLRSVQALKPVLLALRMVPVLEAVSIPHVGSMIDAHGVLLADDGQDRAAGAMLDEMARLTVAMKPLHSATAAP